MDADSSLWSGANVALTSGIFAVVMTMKMVFPEAFASKWGQRFLPLLPVVLGVVGGLLGCVSQTRTQDRVLVGLLCGFAAAHVYKMGKTSLLGHGIDADETPSVSSASDTNKTGGV